MMALDIENIIVPLLRDNDGRFGGRGAVKLPVAKSPTYFMTKSEVDCKLGLKLEESRQKLLGIENDDDSVNAILFRCSPGTGKSQKTIQLIAGFKNTSSVVALHIPTLRLADEASGNARSAGLDAATIRGRDACRPDGGGTMCARADLVNKASRLKLPIRENFCCNREKPGEEILCPNYIGCPYPEQFQTGADVHYLSNNYLYLPDPLEDSRELRIIDETFWQKSLKIHDIPATSFTEPRLFMPNGKTGEHADLIQAAEKLLNALTKPQTDYLANFELSDLRDYAVLERKSLAKSPELKPDLSDQQLTEKLNRAERNCTSARSFSSLWTVLADAKEMGLTHSERVRLITQNNQLHIRLCRVKKPVHKQPVIILDADADKDIIAATGYNVIGSHDMNLRPNAEIFQLHDRRMCNNSLLSYPGIREEWRQIIQREVLIDHLQHGDQGGVLIGATMKVVRQFFEDDGYDFSGMSKDEVVRVMLETKLFGASWLWFGGRATGSNRYREYQTVIVIGREELPSDVLEDQGRALWGDDPDIKLTFLEKGSRPDEKLIEYEMTDGSAFGAYVSCHPDPNIRRLQMQSREYATRQLIERLRLGRSETRKRVLIGCSIPIPCMPVDTLIAWEDLRPTRIEAAIINGLTEHGGVRFSAEGLSAAAPKVFPSADAARGVVKRCGGGLVPEFPVSDPRLKKHITCGSLKRAKPYSRREKYIMLTSCASAEKATGLWGKLIEFESYTTSES